MTLRCKKQKNIVDHIKDVYPMRERENIHDKNSLTVVFWKEVSLKNPKNALGILSCGGIVLVHQKL